MIRESFRTVVTIAILGGLAVLGFANFDPRGDAARAESVQIANDYQQKMNEITLDNLAAQAERQNQIDDAAAANTIAAQKAITEKSQAWNNTIATFLDQFTQKLPALTAAFETAIKFVIFSLVGLVILRLAAYSKPYIQQLISKEPHDAVDPIPANPWASPEYRSAKVAKARQKERDERRRKQREQQQELDIENLIRLYAAVKEPPPDDIKSYPSAGD